MYTPASAVGAVSIAKAAAPIAISVIFAANFIVHLLVMFSLYDNYYSKNRARIVESISGAKACIINMLDCGHDLRNIPTSIPEQNHHWILLLRSFISGWMAAPEIVLISGLMSHLLDCIDL
jgi:hypothetical protein